MLEIRLADDPRLAVRAAAIMPDAELLNPQHLRPALREVIQGGAAHPAQADHDRIVRLTHSRSVAAARSNGLDPSLGARGVAGARVFSLNSPPASGYSWQCAARR